MVYDETNKLQIIKIILVIIDYLALPAIKFTMKKPNVKFVMK